MARFLEREAAEKPQFGDLPLALIQRRKALEGGVEIEHVDVERRHGHRRRIVQRHVDSARAALLGAPGAGAVNEDAPHHLRRDGEELRTILPGRAALIDEPDVRLVHERGRLKGVVRPLAPQVRRGAATKLAIHEHQHTLARLEIPGGPRVQEPGHVVVVGRRHRGGRRMDSADPFPGESRNFRTVDIIDIFPVPLFPGTRLGPYQIECAIGAGGMGEVYKATDTRLGRTVAIKTLTGGHGPRFQQEARAIAALNHPHICVLHDDGPDYLVMEFLDGAPVQGPLPLDDVIRIALQIVDALDTAHGKGIFHRDLKPANIMVTRTGAKVLDFGLAKIVSDSSEADATRTMAGTVLGTAAYMSPEQAQGRPADARSDVFSFGAVLYEMLTGKRAFGGASMLDTLSAVVHDDPAPPDSPAWDVIKRCLAKQPQQRFQTMGEVRAALQQIGADRPARRPSGPSIAVLPFANMSRDADDEYFSDGLAEEIINLLAQVPGLKVIARTSAFAFKGKNEDIRKIAETLGVTTILEGSVRRAGSRIRVMAQLIQASDGAHLWSQRYDREMADVFDVQDEISAAIADALKLKLAPAPERRMPKVAAYEAYLKYRSYQWQFTPEATQRSRECLEQAIALDPAFALPYVGLADSYLALSAVGAIPSHDAMPRARELATRALEIDPDLPEAHAMLGIVAGHYDFDWAEAARRFKAAEREQMSPHLRQWHAYFHLLPTGRAEEGLAEHRRVLDDDPLCQTWYYTLSTTLAALGHQQDARAAVRKSVEIDPGFWVGWMWLGALQAIQRQHDEALSSAEKAIALAPWSPVTMGLIAAVLANVQRHSEAETYLARLRDDAYAGPAGFMMYSVAGGDIGQAVEWASKAVDQRYTIILATLLRPFEPLLSQSPLWPAVLQNMNQRPRRPA